MVGGAQTPQTNAWRCLWSRTHWSTPTFEGVIPDGQYGAGPSILWDRGVCIPIEGPKHGLDQGKLLFGLRGHKLRGLWTLVHTPKAGENHWLFIKERDDHVDERGTDAFAHESIYSGLLVEQLGDPESREREVVRQAMELGAKAGPVEASGVKVMLATQRDEAFTRAGRVFEIKYDGYRLLATRAGGRPELWWRNGNDLTATFPEIARAIHGLPATFYAFDLLSVGGYDVRRLPLLERKHLLREVLPSVGPIRYSDHIAELGEAMFERATAMRS